MERQIKEIYIVYRAKKCLDAYMKNPYWKNKKESALDMIATLIEADLEYIESLKQENEIEIKLGCCENGQYLGVLDLTVVIKKKGKEKKNEGGGSYEGMSEKEEKQEKKEKEG